MYPIHMVFMCLHFLLTFFKSTFISRTDIMCFLILSAFKISSQWVEEFHGVTFPDFRDRREFGLLPKDGILELPSTVLQSYNLSGLPGKNLPLPKQM